MMHAISVRDPLDFCQGRVFAVAFKRAALKAAKLNR
jgi:hypothetical protein